ncbi:MAG: phospholipase D-like domain-containing protein [Bdellovibrionota bacterium]
MKNIKILLCIILLLLSSSCIHKTTNQPETCKSDSGRNISSENEELQISFVPQELYYETILKLLDKVNERTKIIRVLQFNFFTDNPGNSLPKQIAAKIISLKKQYPNLDIEILLESKKDLDKADGKGAAQRNAITKKYFNKNGIKVTDIFGLDASLTPTKKQGVSHAKVVQIDDTVLAGSTNLTQQSTTVGANNEINLLVQSSKIAATILDFINRIKANSSRMHDLQITDGALGVFTDTLLFDRLTGLIDKAGVGDTLDLSMYQFLYRDNRDVQAKIVYEKLVAAKTRGAKIRVYLERTKNSEDETFKTNSRVAELLSENGIEVYFDPTEKISHAKFIVYVGKTEKIAIISSANYYRGDFNENHQVNWQVTNHPLIELLQTYFSQKIAYEGQRYEEMIGKGKPKRMFRFWRGFKQDDVTASDLITKINARLIPETIRVGGKRGLTAYIPAFLPLQRPAGQPDEIALIAYTNEDTYNAIRSTKTGRAYGPLHFETGAFSKDTSKSVLLSQYEGVLPVDAASGFILGDQNTDWQKGFTILRVVSNAANDGKTHMDLLQKNGASFGLNAAAIVVDPNYILEYLNFSNQQLASEFGNKLTAVGDRLEVQSSIPIGINPIGNLKIGAGEGTSIQFDATLAPAHENLRIVLDEIREINEAQTKSFSETPSSTSKNKDTNKNLACPKVFTN